MARLVEAGPAAAGLPHLARWRCSDLKALVFERWGVDYHERTIGKLLDRLGFSHITARPRHRRQDAEAMAAFKKLAPGAGAGPRQACPGCAHRDLVPEHHCQSGSNAVATIASTTTARWMFVSNFFSNNALVPRHRGFDSLSWAGLASGFG